MFSLLAFCSLSVLLSKLMCGVRVPAEQHPQIAPAEFANWLQTHGVIRAKGQLRVRRKRSVLSISYLPDEEDEDDVSKERQPIRRRTYDSATQPPIPSIPETPIIEEE